MQPAQERRHAGTTLHAAPMERRIARARLLMEGALRRGARANLADVAAATGFSSDAHMTTAFGRVLGNDSERMDANNRQPFTP